MLTELPFLLYRRVRRLLWFSLILFILIYTPPPTLAQKSEPVPNLHQNPTPASTAESETVVARVYFRDQADLNHLAASYDLWHVHHSPIAQAQYVVMLLTIADVDTLRDRGYRVEIDEQRTATLDWSPVVTDAQQGGIPGYACYRTVEETYSSLATLAAANPNLATWSDIGDSWEKTAFGDAGGYHIYALQITNRAISGPKPRFFLMAAIHAREYTTAELATRFAEELIAKYGVDPDVTWLLDYFEIHIVPHANPDGRKRAERGQLWRKNTNNTNGCNIPSSWGIDLNRNSSFMWNTGGSSSDACNLTYHGISPASEPETQTIENYARSIFQDQRGPNVNDPAPADAEGIFITLHSYSELVLFPWGYTTTPTPNGDALQTLGRKFGYFNGYQVCTGPNCLYSTSGTTDDFTYGELGVASYTFELGQNFFEPCAFFEADIIPNNMPALYYAAKAARRPYQTPAGPEVIQATATFTATSTGPALFIQATADDTRYNSNGWGVEPSQPITAARLTIDAPSWITTTKAYSMTAEDGRFDKNVETVTTVLDISLWEQGKHIIFVEGQDGAGNWGVPTALFVEINRFYFPFIAQ
jgi:carboxypeptidase T